ncbi:MULTISPECIES: arsenate reductase (azurin) small subunit [unclassified Sulfurospirillum]|uniref:arsenate reductase (azurin) small subunit n=1 Tax=unclassified Sulfurospirillum TaxID=2618290 RepID=UPI0004FF8D6D|nr:MULTISPECIES: arsenate reductase (azurin) small subunit [unclassified Sulfurospirillum]KFL33120.1 twin-arginine translocation pathway signal protein [Sulfurospirillum sp. SCADC]
MEIVEAKQTRRDFFKFSALSLGAVVATPSLIAGTAHPGMSVYGGYTKNRVGSLAQLKKTGELDFSYPDENALCKAVYVNNEVKAYSIICTHKGCPTVYNQEKAMFECPCHFTKYDAKNNGQMVIGQATGALPRVLLEIRGDDIFAMGVDGLIFGRINNNVG